MAYSLFQSINNEAYDEDNKAKREALKRTLEQVKMFGVERSVPRTDLDYTMKLTFTRLFTVFSHEIDRNIQQFHQEALVKDTDKLPLFYNQLASFIDGLNTQAISQTNISVGNMIRKIDDLEPKLRQLYDISVRQNYTDKNVVQEILQNIRAHTYRPVSMKFNADNHELVLARAENFQQAVSNADMLLTKVQGLFYLDTLDRQKIIKIGVEFQDIKETFILQHQNRNFSQNVAKGKVEAIVVDLRRLERKNYERNTSAFDDARTILETKLRIGQTTALISEVKTAMGEDAKQQGDGYKFAKQFQMADSDLSNLENQSFELTAVEDELTRKDKLYSVDFYHTMNEKIQAGKKLVDAIYNKWDGLLSGRRTDFKREILSNENGEILFSFPGMPPNPVNAVGLPDEFFVPIPMVEKKKIAPLPMAVMDVKRQTTLIPAQFARVDEENIKIARTQRERNFRLAQENARRQGLELEKAQRAEQREDDREIAIERQKNLNRMIIAVAKFTKKSKEEIKDQYLDELEDRGEDIAYNNLKVFYEVNVAPPIIEEEGEEREQEGKDVIRIGRAEFEKDRKRILNEILESDENITKAQLDEELRTATVLFKGDEVKALRYVLKSFLDQDLGEIVIEGKGKPKKKATHFRGLTGRMFHDGE